MATDIALLTHSSKFEGFFLMSSVICWCSLLGLLGMSVEFSTVRVCKKYGEDFPVFLMKMLEPKVRLSGVSSHSCVNLSRFNLSFDLVLAGGFTPLRRRFHNG